MQGTDVHPVYDRIIQLQRYNVVIIVSFVGAGFAAFIM